MNKNLKRASALGLSLIMAFSLAGCKNDSKKDKDDKNTESAAEYGYNVEYVELNKEVQHMGRSFLKGNELFFTSYEWSEDSPISSIALKSIDLSSPDDVKTYVKYEMNENQGIDIAFFYPDDNGKITLLKTEYTFEDSGEDSDIDLGDIPADAAITEEYLQQLNINLESVGLVFQDISDMTVSEVMSLYRQLTGEETGSTTEDNGVSTLITVDSEGKEISSGDVSDKLQNIYPQYIARDKDGNIYLYSQTWLDDTGNNVESTMTMIDSSSLEIDTVKLDGGEFCGMTNTGNGNIAGVLYDDEGDCIVKTWDNEKKSFTGDSDNTISAMWVQDIYPADNDSFYYTYDGILYRYDISKHKDEKILKFVDWNISADNISGICYVDEDHMMIITNDYSGKDETVLLNKLTRVKASELAQKKEITLGCLSASQQIQNAVIDFNKKSSDYKIVIKDYFSMDEDADYDEIISKFNNDILSGEGPDLIDLTSLDYSRYEGTGLFEDLYPYINSDPEFSKRNFNQNILKLFEQNGALYAFPSSYTITALASEKSLLGDSDLTLDKFTEVVQSNGDKEILAYATQDSILYTLFTYNEDYFIDYGNKTCNFTDGTFEKILNAAKGFPTQEELDDSMDDNNYISEPQKISEGNLLFYQMNLSDPNEYQIPAVLFNNNFNITGYPSVEGNKIAAYATSNLFAINAKSQHKDDCWTFIKILFDKEEYYNGFSVDNDKLDEYLKQFSTPNLKTDENGNLVEEPSTYGFDDFELKLYALTDEQVTKIKELTNSVNTLAAVQYTGDVYEIINEESAAFFNSEKSAADVCDIIQSRVNILINEND